MLDMVSPMVITACGAEYGPERLAKHYYTTWFARPDCLKGSLKATLVAARPTLFLGVPRVWEKIKEGMQEFGRKGSPLARAVGSWAKRHAAAAAQQRQLGGSGARSIAYLIARRLILGKVKMALGLDQCLVCLTGAAPMQRGVSSYFGSIDIDLLGVYGMSESSDGGTFSSPLVYGAGSVGAPSPGSEVHIDHVPGRDRPGEGEICYRGRHIMMGYMKEEAKTAEAIDEHGWLHSGDVGVLGDDGMLRITGRIKELIITAGGENIAPVPIEDKLKELLHALSNIMMVGDRRKYNVCLFTIKTHLDSETGLSMGRLALEAATVSSAATAAEAIAESMVRGSAWQSYLQRGINQLNAKHAVSNAQKVQKFTLLPGDFSERGGELTATLKLKRACAAKIHATAIDSLYGNAGAPGAA